MKGDIYRYEVRRELTRDPMYGKSKLYGKYENMEDAIAYAEDLAKKYDDVFVWRKTYTCEENLKKDFALCADYVWSSWFGRYR